MLASATSDPTRENGGVVAPASMILQNAVNVGLSYQPLFLEYWTDDCTNPATASTIQSATVTLEGNGFTGTSSPAPAAVVGSASLSHPGRRRSRTATPAAGQRANSAR
jgi:hypothetical protein